jgi:hypothetical protein
LSGAPYKQKRPGAAYIEQVETYAYMLYKQYSIRVEGVMLMFLPRDNPKQPTVWVETVDSKDFKRISKRIKSYKQMHREALAAETMREALALAKYGKCKGEWCATCKSPQSLEKQIKRAYKMGKAAGHLPLSELQ